MIIGAIMSSGGKIFVACFGVSVEFYGSLMDLRTEWFEIILMFGIDGCHRILRRCAALLSW
jgi:hypothetical protein